MIPNEFKGRYAYHFTHIDNLPSIIESGLLSTNEKQKNGIEHTDVANSSIQERRSKMIVTCGPGGVVHDYVPFYFAKRTPMLLNIVKSKNVDQELVVFLAVPIDKVTERNTVFSEASANTTVPPQFHSKPKHLSKLNWDVIDCWKWTYSDGNSKHEKMAEMLVHQKIGIDDVSHIVVWHKGFKNHVKKTLEQHGVEGIKVVTDYHKHFKHHYFTDFKADGRVNIATGPRRLAVLVKRNVEEVLAEEESTSTFDSLAEAVEGIANDFCCIKELDDIEGLKTSNPIHIEDVGAHSRSVANLVREQPDFDSLSENDQNILVLSAYLHDIGKGPKSRWEDEVQDVDDEHPRKSLPMLKRILTEDIANLVEDDVRRIHMLVVYDDLVGDIVARSRDKRQLFKVIKSKSDVDLLISIARADMGSINPEWIQEHEESIEVLRKEAYEYLEKNK
ncbi:hypothetical protein BJL85_15760 [Vibrio parahaemolyticus]|uniref:type II toxin-antitoxin system toxin DNA ADP-ribosyl transferase DarT n=1 Tax=Vibrio parahaemolyticus TaxID=670 RepID=UPI0009988361|nr:DarT ssDNA thymidine ADP-ribosyltransferase family protein [Vibrio parahaemolyticus]OOX29516.1 hypothetical protein BJL85_15760 [Vibrio parahaemolyticus]